MKPAPRLGAIFLTVFVDLLGFGLVLPFLAKEARDTFGVSAFVATLLASAYSLMQFLFVPVWGRLSDRVGRRPVLVWSIAATSVCMASLGAALARVPESLPPERRAATPRRRLTPLNVAAMRDAFELPGVALCVLVNFLVIASFTNLDQTFTLFCGDLF